MARALDVAKFLAALAQQESEPELLTNMRVQKLVYYAQGWSLASREKPLISDDIQAWRQGPVVQPLYDVLKAFGDQPIAAEALAGAKDLSRDEQAAVRSVWEGYKKYSASGLSDMTHQESPWKDSYTPDSNGRCSKVIPHAVMRSYFGGVIAKKQPKLPTFSLERIRRSERAFAEGKYRTFAQVFPT